MMEPMTKTEALKEVERLRQWLRAIYDHDDGAWAAGKYRRQATKAGILTMHGMAAAALRGESLTDFVQGVKP